MAVIIPMIIIMTTAIVKIIVTDIFIVFYFVLCILWYRWKEYCLI